MYKIQWFIRVQITTFLFCSYPEPRIYSLLSGFWWVSQAIRVLVGVIVRSIVVGPGTLERQTGYQFRSGGAPAWEWGTVRVPVWGVAKFHWGPSSVGVLPLWYEVLGDIVRTSGGTTIVQAIRNTYFDVCIVCLCENWFWVSNDFFATSYVRNRDQHSHFSFLLLNNLKS